MVETIASDFGVTLRVQNGNNYFFADMKTAFLHVVFFKENDHFNEINQFYIHRYEFADWLNQEINKSKYNQIKLASGLIHLCYSSNQEKQNIRFFYGDATFDINLKDNNDFEKQLIADVSVLEKIDSQLIKKATRKKIISAIVDEYDENETYPISDSSLRAAAFELKISKTKKTWHRTSYFYDLVKMEINDSKEMNTYLASNLLMGLDVVVGKTECNCGNDGCFFEMLNTAYTTYFKEEELLTDGKLDEAKAEIQLAKIWDKLTLKERVVLNFLDDQFGNTPLINLYLLTPNANVQEYIYKMTYPYQPDSEDDLFVRKISSWVGFYLS